MRLLVGIVALCFALLTGVAHAEPRVALVVGNGGYGTVTPLDNPGNDAQLIGETLKQTGFDVTVLLDASQVEMKRAIAQFGRDLRAAGPQATGLFYYAGHGVQSFGTNYLLPVDVAVSNAADLDLVAVEAQSVLRQMYTARNRTNILILDACRNNPFTGVADFMTDGLAEMSAPTGTYLAYATGPGEVALDGAGSNSPFSAALARHMATPDMPIERVFKAVRNDVLEETQGRQTPWDASSLTTEFVFAAAPRQTAEVMEAEQVWASIQNTDDPVQVMLFIRGYPDSPHIAEARVLLQTLLLEAEVIDKPQPAQTGPTEEEQQLFAAAQANPTAAAYQAYLDAYPDGTFAEIARMELAALGTPAAVDPVGQGGQGVVAKMETPDPVAPKAEITFQGPIQTTRAELQGLSIEDMLQMSPEFAPVEGLPESYWKAQTCSGCHEWNRERVCEYGQSYLTASAERALTHMHPFGGALKTNLRDWAAGGCR
ncbi:MAG: caspase domain-containing protein [Paracoccaceae bacterium]